MDLGLAGKTALVTGGTSGIGRATREALAREGAHVLISGRNEARGAEVVAAINAGGSEAEFVRADLESPDHVRALAEHAANVDILVDNAGDARRVSADPRIRLVRHSERPSAALGERPRVEG